MKTFKCRCGKDIFCDDDKLDELLLHFELNKWQCRGNYIYFFIIINGKKFAINVAKLVIGPIPKGMMYEHKDRDVHNLQKENLRPATRSQNNANARAKENSTGFRYVSRCNSKCNPYRVTVSKDGVIHSGGSHPTPEMAARVGDRLALRLHGPEFASLNFPLSDYV